MVVGTTSGVGTASSQGLLDPGNERFSMFSKPLEFTMVMHHRFRDAFAVELLLSGVPLERVSVLLGHSSVKITERHYAPWVRERQEQMEADVRRLGSAILS